MTWFVMSTASEMERTPASVRRDTIHGGVGRDRSRPETTRVTKTSAPTRPRIGAASSTRTSTPATGASAASRARASAGSVNAAPVACAYSRAIPRIENA